MNPADHPIQKYAGANPVARSADVRVFVHLHIPKNAGTTLNDIFRRSFGDGFRNIHALYGHAYKGHWPVADFIAAVTSQPPGATLISNHHILMPPPEACRRHGLSFFTIIREPVERIVSLYHYERKWSKLAPERYCADHPSQLPFEKYVEARMAMDDHLCDWQTRDLCGKADLDAAKAVLDRCDCVGVTDQFDRFLLCLRSVMHPLRLKVFYERKNTSPGRDATLATMTPELRRRLRDWNRLDHELHRYAAERLRSQAGKAGVTDAAVRRFQIANRFNTARLRAYRRVRGGLGSLARKVIPR